MTKLLIARGKYTTLHFDISTPVREQQAWLALAGFNMHMGYYHNVGDDPEQEDALAGARAGNWKDAQWLCQLRDDYEYEGWTIQHSVSESQIDEWIGKLQKEAV